MLKEFIDGLVGLAKGSLGATTASVSISGSGLPSSIPTVFNHNKGQFEGVKEMAEKWRLHPERRTGAAETETLASFIALVNRHKTADKSVVFAKASWPRPSLLAVLNYHPDKPDAPANWLDHLVGYEFPTSPEFTEWLDHNGADNCMDQGRFAHFVEDRIADISEATEDEKRRLEPLFRTKFALPFEMIELSRGLEVHENARVKNAQTLQSGERELVFETEHVSASGDKLTVPGLFMVAVRAFIGGEIVRVPARLRYRISGGALIWFYDLYRWEDILRDRVVGDLAIVAEQTGLPTFEGRPEGRR
jgi:uncharacterized protein YfdQ (DUF2303 family)